MDNIFLLVFIFITYCSSSDTQSNECIRKGVPLPCVVLKDCPELLQGHLPLVFPVSDSLRAILKNAHCGFEGTVPKVCCPLKEKSQALSTASPEHIGNKTPQSNSPKDVIHPSSRSTWDSDNCNSKGSPRKECKILRDCTELLQKHLPLVFPLSDPVKSILKEAHCGFKGRVPKVCCPVKEQPDSLGTATTGERANDTEQPNDREDGTKSRSSNSWGIPYQFTTIKDQDSGDMSLRFSTNQTKSNSQWVNPVTSSDQWGIPQQPSLTKDQNSDDTSERSSTTSNKLINQWGNPATSSDQWGIPQQPSSTKDQNSDDTSQTSPTTSSKLNNQWGNPATSSDQWGIPQQPSSTKDQNSDDTNQTSPTTSNKLNNQWGNPATSSDQWGIPQQPSSTKDQNSDDTSQTSHTTSNKLNNNQWGNPATSSDQWGVPKQPTSINDQDSDGVSKELFTTSKKPDNQLDNPVTSSDQWGIPKHSTLTNNQDSDGISQGFLTTSKKPHNHWVNSVTSSDQWGIPQLPLLTKDQNSDDTSQRSSTTSKTQNNQWGNPATSADQWGIPNQSTSINGQDSNDINQGFPTITKKTNNQWGNSMTSLDQWGIPQQSTSIKIQNSDDTSQQISTTPNNLFTQWGDSLPHPNKVDVSKQPVTNNLENDSLGTFEISKQSSNQEGNIESPVQPIQSTTQNNINIWGTLQNFPPIEDSSSSRSTSALPSVVDRLAAEKQNLPAVTGHANYGLLPADCGQISDVAMKTDDNRYRHPWMALIAHNIQGKISHACVGTVMNNFYILTAASCITQLGSGVTVAGVRIGEYDISKDQDCDKDGKNCAPEVQNFAYEGYYVHKEYNTNTMQNDIGLIRVSRPIDFTRENSRPICLPVNEPLMNMALEGNTMNAPSWPDESGTKVRVLEEKSYNIIPNKRCMELSEDNDIHISEQQGCALTIPCTSNTGGPLIMASSVGSKTLHFQHGIVSYNPKNCTLAVSSVFTRVANYLPWILDTIAP